MDDVSLRLATPADEAFLRRLYAANLVGEFRSAGLDAEQTAALTQIQYTARNARYEACFPDAQNWIVLLEGTPVGRHLVQPAASVWEFIDLALLPAFHGRGIGTFVLEQHLQRAMEVGASAQLHVRIGNPAKRLYERLGFVVTDQDGVYYRMQCVPGPENQGRA